MATISLRGTPATTSGELPTVGTPAPDFSVTKADLSEATLATYAGKNLILNIYPSIDTPTCAQSTRRFNEDVAAMDNTVVLCVSADLPFAQSRFCGAEGLDQVETGSTFRSGFALDYGVQMVDGPLQGLTARAVVVVSPEGIVTHAELVPEIAQEPDYAAAKAAIQ
ncbi:thiol peroxidase [Litorivicinus lipolyticus]|uniref:Thiol peroxidase n=1 Tax=Litorivicinus lipolyticus TaxID=418701 RepID=A0A5Q2QDS6_9GAMM|nr:thiol peroxidase [Litorivicinus lipolyticus]QGG80521.1 thiol peroxidase [Litorivicinus lipolyticus]